jgi:hypothetical protein
MESINPVAALPIEIMHFFLSHYLDDAALKVFPIVCRAWLLIEETHKQLWVQRKAEFFPDDKKPYGLVNQEVACKNPVKAACVVERSFCIQLFWSHCEVYFQLVRERFCNGAGRRILRELKDCTIDPPANISLGPDTHSDLYKWTGTMLGMLWWRASNELDSVE